MRGTTRASLAPMARLPREVLEPLVVAGGTIRSIAEALDVQPSTARYWLRRHGLRTLRHRQHHEIPPDRPDRLELECPRHGRTTFGRRADDGGYRCLKCRSAQVSEQRRRQKLVLIEEAGGRCQLCGYDRCPSALHFHHLRPEDKAFALSQQGAYRALARARAEAQKCAVLCANCHAEVESGFRTLASIHPIPG
jgi:hypothetical protein